MCRLGISAFIASVFSLLFVSRVLAASEDAKERTARKACLSGNYQKGVEILSDLFVRTKDPIFIYNQGRCFEQNGRYEESILRFREYLRKDKYASAQIKADAQRHIADCQALLGKNAAPEPGPKPEAMPATKPEIAPAPPPVAEAVREAVVAPLVAPGLEVAATSEQLVANPTSQAQNTGLGLRIAGIACGVVGLGSIATAIYFYTRARSLSDKISKQDVPDPSDVSSGENAETMQWVFYGIGGAAIATGTVLYVLGWRSAGTGHASLAPMVGPGLAGIWARGAF